MAVTIKKITDADILAIDTIQKAKDYKIGGKPLADNEKDIFDNNLLNESDGTLDLNKLRKTLVYLCNYKTSKEVVKTQTMGLNADGQALLNSLLVEQKADSLV